MILFLYIYTYILAYPRRLFILYGFTCIYPHACIELHEKQYSTAHKWQPNELHCKNFIDIHCERECNAICCCFCWNYFFIFFSYFRIWVFNLFFLFLFLLFLFFFIFFFLFHFQLYYNLTQIYRSEKNVSEQKNFFFFMK